MVAAGWLSPVALRAVTVTFTVVPAGSGHRIGIDRDDDGLLDYDEVRDLAPDVPGIQNPFRPDSSDATGNSSVSPDGTADGLNDFDGDGLSSQQELANGTNPADNLNVIVPFNLQMTTAPNAAMVTLRWDAGPLGVYQVQSSIDLAQWADSPTGRLANNGLAIAPQSWTDTGPPATPTPPSETPLRFYRVERLR